MNRNGKIDPLIRDVVTAFQVSSKSGEQYARVSRLLAEAVEARYCLIFQVDKSSGGLVLAGFHNIGSSVPDAGHDISKNDAISMAVSQKSPVPCYSSRKSAGAPVPDYLTEEIGRGFAVPLLWREKLGGVIFIGYEHGGRGRIPSKHIDRIIAASEIISPLIRGSNRRRYQLRKNEIAGQLLDISADLGASTTIEECMAEITRAATELTRSSGAVLRIQRGGEPGVRSFFSREALQYSVIDTPNDLDAAVRVIDCGRAVNVDDIPRGGPAQRNILSVPFSDSFGMPGALSVFDIRSENGFTANYSRLERETMYTLARIGMNALIHHEKDKKVKEISRSLELRIRELAFLHHISRSALRTGGTKDILRSLLTAVTHGQGLGFDRAFLFLHDIDNKRLNGTIGVEVAERSHNGRVDETAEIGSDHVEEHQSALDEQIEGFSVPIDAAGGVLPRTVMERRPYHIRLPRDRDLVSQEVVSFMGGTTSFVTVPLLSEDRVLGVIWVDNLHSGRSISVEDIRLLVSAAAQAGLIVERSFKTEELETLSSQMIDLQKRLIQWEKMAALGEMAASVAHDIRNPLVSIGGFARRLRKLHPSEGPGDRYTDIIIREVNRLERILANVMSFSKSYGEIDREPVALDTLLRDCTELFRENFKRKGVLLERKIDTAIPEVNIDKRQIKQAVINILFNAGDAVKEMGKVYLEATMESEGDNRVVRISVADNGEGISPDHLKQVFEPFFTTKGAGTGLGLSIAQRAITGHGGEIRVDNRYGEGVTFTITLPVGSNERLRQ